MEAVQLELFEEFRDFRLHRKYRDGVFKTKFEIEQDLLDQGKTRIYRVLSFGGGTQSAYLMEQHLRGKIDYDYIIFSDTGAEPQFIHDQVEWWRRRQRELGNQTPFIITHHKSMDRGLEEMLMRYIHTDYQRLQMPIYCSNIDKKTGEEFPAGMMPRQCTVDFKIIPVQQMARRQVLKQLGLNKNKKMPDNVGFIIDIGFSYDEIRRVNTYQSPQYKYMYLAYPLIEENITATESIHFLKENGFPTDRSRCYLCPFQCDRPEVGMDWREVIYSEPLSFLKACYFDEELRRVQKTGTKIMRSIPYLHYSRRPLMEVYQGEYLKFRQLFNREFENWVDEWDTLLKEKYGHSVKKRFRPFRSKSEVQFSC